MSSLYREALSLSASRVLEAGREQETSKKSDTERLRVKDGYPSGKWKRQREEAERESQAERQSDGGREMETGGPAATQAGSFSRHSIWKAEPARGGAAGLSETPWGLRCASALIYLHGPEI